MVENDEAIRNIELLVLGFYGTRLSSLYRDGTVPRREGWGRWSVGVRWE